LPVTDQTSDTAAAGTDRSIDPTRFDPVTDPRPHDAPWPAMTWPMAPGLALRGRLVQLTAVDPDRDTARLFEALDGDAVWEHVPGRPSDTAG
jgi:hypothetical protein